MKKKNNNKCIEIKCEECGGSGFDYMSTDVEECIVCGGIGYICEDLKSKNKKEKK